MTPLLPSSRKHPPALTPPSHIHSTYDISYESSSIQPKENDLTGKGDSVFWDHLDKAGVYQVRGPGYLQNRVKIPARVSAMEMLGSQFIFSKDPITNITAAPGHLVQEQHVGQADRPFLFVTNFIVPQIGNWVTYFARRRGQDEDLVFEKMLQQFMDGDDENRNKVGWGGAQSRVHA